MFLIIDIRFPKAHITTKNRKATEHISTETMERWELLCKRLCVTLSLISPYLWLVFKCYIHFGK